jgi:hypothetical protein
LNYGCARYVEELPAFDRYALYRTAAMVKEMVWSRCSLHDHAAAFLVSLLPAWYHRSLFETLPMWNPVCTTSAMASATDMSRSYRP